MLTRDDVPEGAASAPGVNPGAWSTAFTPFLLSFSNALPVSLVVALPMTEVADYLCVRVRCGVVLLPLVVALALALPFSLLAFALALLFTLLSFVNYADVHWRWTIQGFAGHDDAAYLLSNQRVR